VRFAGALPSPPQNHLSASRTPDPCLHRQDAAGAPIAPQSASKEFHVVAKKDDVHEVVLDGRTCQMTFRAANSAHGELWKMELKKEWIDKQHVYTCLIEDQDKAPPHASFYGYVRSSRLHARAHASMHMHTHHLYTCLSHSKPMGTSAHTRTNIGQYALKSIHT
jgi:hypothetical protein